MKKITYLYSQNRNFRFNDTYADDFLYGYKLLKDNNKYDLSYVELKNSSSSLFLNFKCKIYSYLFKIGFSDNKIIDNLKDIQNSQIIVATNDSIALGAAFLKKRFNLKYKIIYLNMGLGDRLYKLKNKPFLLFLFKFILNTRFKNIESIVCLGVVEKLFLENEFRNKNFEYCSFAIDTNFWKYNRYNFHDRDYITFIGNDSNRDFKLLEKIIDKFPQERFFVLTNKNLTFKNKNVKYDFGHINNENSINDLKLLEIYHKSKFVLIPLKDCIQPSGQSVMLQSMSSGTPVLISKANGLFNNSLKHNLNCIVAEDSKDFENKFQLILNNEYQLTSISQAGRNLCESKFNKFVFYNFLSNLIINL